MPFASAEMPGAQRVTRIALRPTPSYEGDRSHEPVPAILKVLASLIAGDRAAEGFYQEHEHDSCHPSENDTERCAEDESSLVRPRRQEGLLENGDHRSVPHLRDPCLLVRLHERRQDGLAQHHLPFCYVEDEVEGIYRLFGSDQVGPVNIGNPVEFTIRELADIVLDESGGTSTIEILPLPTDDPKVRQPDISAARDLLDWEPEVDLQTGVRRTLPYFREELERNDAKARTT